jgi:hypothetical protein
VDAERSTRLAYLTSIAPHHQRASNRYVTDEDARSLLSSTVCRSRLGSTALLAGDATDSLRVGGFVGLYKMAA